MKQILSDQDVADLIEMVPDDFDMPIYFAFVRTVESAVLAKVEPYFRRMLIILEADEKVHTEVALADLEPLTSEIRALLGEES